MLDRLKVMGSRILAASDFTITCLTMKMACALYFTLSSLLLVFMFTEIGNILKDLSIGQLIFLGICLAIAIKTGHHLFRLQSLKAGGLYYSPGQRFKFYRSSAAARIKIYRILKILSLIAGGMALGVLASKKGMSFAKMLIIISSTVALTCAFDTMAGQIKAHVRIDDASLFELEDLGLVKSYNLVTALYKDFSSWDEVKEGSKLLMLTHDEFVALSFTSRNSALKYTLRLSQIERLDIMKYSFLFHPNGSGLKQMINPDSYTYTTLLFAARAQGDVVHLILKGNSYQDSPEEFFRQMLIDLDNTMLNKPSQPKAEIAIRDKSVTAPVRQIEFEDLNAAYVPNNDSKARIIEF